MVRQAKPVEERAVKVGISLVPPIIAQLDAIAATDAGGNRSAIVSRLITDETARRSGRAPGGPAMPDTPAQPSLLAPPDEGAGAPRLPRDVARETRYIGRLETRLKALIIEAEVAIEYLPIVLDAAKSSNEDWFRGERAEIRKMIYGLSGRAIDACADIDNGLGVDDENDTPAGPDYDSPEQQRFLAQMARDVRDGKRDWGVGGSDAQMDAAEAALAREEGRPVPPPWKPGDPP